MVALQRVDTFAALTVVDVTTANGNETDFSMLLIFFKMMTATENLAAWAGTAGSVELSLDANQKPGTPRFVGYW